MNLGDASRDETEIQVISTTRQEQEDRSRTYETDHLCLTCAHAPVCGVLGAIRQLNAEGDIVISVCGAHSPDGPPLAELMDLEGNNDGS